MTGLDSLDREYRESSEFRKHSDRSARRVQIADMIIGLRQRMGWSQRELAERLGTKQPAIVRIESGNHLPSMLMLERIAEAADVYLTTPAFSFYGFKEANPSPDGKEGE